MTSNNYDLFISYNSAQLDKGVTEICNYLQNRFNLNIWFNKDQNNLSSSSSSSSSISELNALESSLIFLCFPSNEYKKSTKNKLEYSIALKQEMRIIELRLYNDMRDFKLPNTTQIKLYDLIDRPNSDEFKKNIYSIKFEVDKMKQIFGQQSIKK